VRALYIVGGIAQVILGIGGFLIPAIMSLENNNANGHTSEQKTTEIPTAPTYVEVA